MTTITIYHGLKIYYDDAGQIRAEFADMVFNSVDLAKGWIDDQVAAGNLIEVDDDPEDDAPAWWDNSDDYEETAEHCPRCNFILLQNKYTGFYHCSNIECKFESTDITEI